MKHIRVQVHPYLEYLNSILMTGRYNEMTRPCIGYGLMTEEVNEYTTHIRHFFKDHLNAPIYRYIENMIPNGFTFSRPVELMLCMQHSSDFSMQYTPSDLCIRYCGGYGKIQELLHLLKEFENTIGYFAFFDETKAYYNPIIEKATNLVNQYPYISMLEDEFGKEQNSYDCVISSLMVGNYGISFMDKTTHRADIFAVFSIDGFSLSAPVFFHEYSHPFINPLTEKYADLVKEYENACELLKRYKLAGFKSGYGDWNECVNEHLVRAMVIHLLRKCNLFDLAEEALSRDLYFGYKYIPYIIEQYKYYDHNRDTYNCFDDFYPKLLEVFSRNIEKQS